MLQQLLFLRSTGLNEQAAVNGLVEHMHALIIGILGSQPSGNLLRRPVQHQFTRNDLYISVKQNWFAVMPASVQTGQRGVNRVEFRVMQDGKVPKDFLKLTEPSGQKDLDRASVTAIPAAAPFGHLPEKFSQPSITLRITFYLQHGPRKEAPKRRFNEINPEVLIYYPR